MASLPFPDTGTRMVLYASGRPAAGLSGDLFFDVACTTPAEVYADSAGVKGSLIADSRITLDQFGQQPDYWGPVSGRDFLYLRIGGVVSRVDADYNARLDALGTRLTAVEGGAASAVTSVAGRVGAIVLTASDVGGVETPAGAQDKAGTALSNALAALTDHAADTTAVHGIADTTALETQAGAQTKATAAQNAATAASDPVGTAAAAVNVHAADTTDVHGIADTTVLETTAGAQAKANAAAASSIPLSQKAIADGVATLGPDGKLVAGQVPAESLTNYLGPADDEPAMLALVGQPGDFTTRLDLSTTWQIIGNDPTQVSSWHELSYPTAPVTSVAGRAGAVVVTKTDVGLGNVANTAPANLPVSTAAQTALDLKADLASPTFTGTVSGITKAMVGLAAADNTHDADKPVSTLTQAALDGKQNVDTDLTAIAGLDSATSITVASDGAGWTGKTPTTMRTWLGLGTAAVAATGTGDTNVILGGDARLTDARTPVDGSVTTGKIATGAVTSAQLADQTITDADIANNAAIGLAKVPAAASRLTVTATKSGAYTAVANELVLCDATGAAFAVTLPSASAAGYGSSVVVQKVDGSGNAVTVQRGGSDTIGAAGTSVTVALADETVTFTSDGASKWILAGGQKSLATLDARYAVDGAVAHRTGDETIAGIKTFSSAPVVPASFVFKAYTTARREILANDPLYGTPGTRAAFIAALDAAEALGPYTTVRIPAGLTVDVVSSLSMSGRTACIKGDAGGVAITSPYIGQGSVITASAQTGPVIDFTGWISPWSFRGAVEPISHLTIQGSGVADPTKANAGVKFAALGSAYVHDLAISKTGGPCLWLAPNSGNATYLSDFERIAMHGPIGAEANDVPFFLADECNGNRFRGMRFRSDSGLYAGASGVAIITSTTYRTEYTLLDAWWWENTDVPTNGCLLSIMGNGIDVLNWQIFDVGKKSGATGTAHFRVLPPPNQSAGGNRFLGYIPGADSGDVASIDAGIVLSQSWNYISGVKGYKGSNVVLNPGVDHCTVHLFGSLGNGTDPGVVDNSGSSNNHFIDDYLKTETRPQGWAVNGVTQRSGTGAPTSTVANIGDTYAQTDGSPGTSLWHKSQVNASSNGWHPMVQEYLATATLTVNQSLSFTQAPGWLITAAGSFALTSFTGARTGGRFTIMVKQDATGSRVITWPSNVVWAGGVAPILSTTPAAVDVLELMFDGTNWQELSRKLAWQSTAAPVLATNAADHNLAAWTFDVGDTVAFGVLSTAGVGNLIRVPVRQKTSITNIVIYVGTAGSGLTAGQCFAALYTGAGALVGVTADQSTAWASNGVKTMALVGGPYIVTPGYVYIDLWFNGTTSPALARSASLITGAANVGLAAPNLRYATADSALTTAAPATLGTQTATGLMFWAGLS